MQVNISMDAHGNCQNCVVEDQSQWNKPSDFPVINQEFSGTKNTHIYAATSSGSRRSLPHFPFDTVLKVNTVDKSTQTWSTGRRRFIGEPIFISKKGAKAEDDGYLFVVEVSIIYNQCLYLFSLFFFFMYENT